MARYVALLRGVNVGGSNIIRMAELKAAFERQGFEHVVTYINSGNLLFDSETTDEAALRAALEERIAADFGLSVPVFVISANDLREAVSHAPAWWNDTPDKSTRHETFFVIPPMTAAELFSRVGEINPEIEKAAHCGRVIFWSVQMAAYTRARWSRITKDKALYAAITVRNANTALKLADIAGGDAGYGQNVRV